MQTIALGGGALAVRLDRGILLVRNAWDANWVEPQNNIITDFEEIFLEALIRVLLLLFWM